MKVNDSLKNNCELLEVKAGGLRVIHKYEFGSYKVVSGKAGGTTTKTNSKLFSRFSESESTQKMSFVFTGNAIDTVQVNMFSQSKSQYRTTHSISFSRKGAQREPDNETQQSLDSFVAVISKLNDTTAWQVIFITEYDKNLQKNKLTRFLTDGNTEIEIREVNESDNGKQSLLWICHGFEFFLDKKPIAAVQTMIKQFVWLNKDLDQNMKLIMATACATMLLSPHGKHFSD